MNKFTIISSILAIVCIITMSTLPDSEAKLWDFIIDVKFLKNPISIDENPILSGTLVDHAYRPVSDVNVKVSFAGKSYDLKTDVNGEFGKQFHIDNLKPRTYSVQIFAVSDDGKKSMSSTTLQINGHVPKTAKIERQLESMEMANDSSKLRKNSNDPISIILYEHYLKLQEKFEEEKYNEAQLDLPQQKIREIRQNVHDKLIQTLEKRPLNERQYEDSPNLSKFMQTLDDEKRYLFELQLNSTKIRYSEGQNLMKEMLENGISYEKARLAYLEYVSITKDEMISIINDTQKIEISPETSTNSTQN